MNPIASSFVPSAPTASYSGLDNMAISTQTMFRALETEQQAHHRTKAALEKALAKVQDVEAENTKMAKETKSLVAAVNMLGGIIKHNKGNLRTRDPPTTSIKKSRKESSVDVTDQVKSRNPSEPQPILYDVLARRRAELADHESSVTDSASVQDSATTEKATFQADRSDLFNLDLLKSPTSTDSTSLAAISRKLRKHFLLDTDEDYSGTFTKANGETELIHITPEQVKNAAMGASTMAQPPINPDFDATPTKPVQVLASALSVGDGATSKPDEVKVSDETHDQIDC